MEALGKWAFIIGLIIGYSLADYSIDYNKILSKINYAKSRIKKVRIVS